MDRVQVINEVIDSYYQSIPNKHLKHPKVVVVFSGVPGSGKTTLARKLSGDLKFAYIQNDAMRDMLRVNQIDPTSVKISDITAMVAKRLFDHADNKSLILDASIDRTWREFFERVEAEGARPLVIRMDMPVETVTSQLVKREGKARSPEDMAKFRKQFEDCKRHVRADIELTPGYSYDRVLKQLRRLLDLES